MPDFLAKMIIVIAAAGLVLFLLALIGLFVRRRNRRSSVRPTGPGWTMEEVDKLHASGQLTDNQYRDLRQVLMADLQKNVNAGASDNSRPII